MTDNFKTVILNETLNYAFFHFTDEKNMDFIDKEGLKANIGTHAKNIEETPKIFFSYGLEGVLQNCDVWLKWLVNKAYSEADRFQFYKGKSREETQELIKEWYQKFRSREYLVDQERLVPFFEKIYERMGQQKYLVLDLKEGEDFRYDDIDEPKKRVLEHKNDKFIDYIFAREMYGAFSDFRSIRVDRWNMHTLQGHDIERNKIKKLITKDNKDDMTSIIIDIYDQYKKKDIKYDMLDKFIIYAKEKRYKESTVTKSNGTYLNLSKLVEISQSVTISQENPQDKFSKTNVK